jgi:uncharacterized protein (TIGR02246 family)
MRIRRKMIGMGVACLFLSCASTALMTGATRGNARTRSSASAAPLHASAATFARAAGPVTPGDQSQIRAVLETQVAAWNRGDIDAFMKYYWRSDKTLFVGANGVTRGWQAVLDRYHRAYPDRKAMGRLTFSNIEIQQDCPQAAVVIGEYHLQREKDNPSGVFTLNFRKFPEGWRIVVDHTTAFSSARMAARRQ